MIFDVIGDLLADRRQRKQFGFNERIVGLPDKLLTPGRLITQVVKPIMYAEHSTVGLGAVTLVELSLKRRMPDADVGSQSADTIEFGF